MNSGSCVNGVLTHEYNGAAYLNYKCFDEPQVRKSIDMDEKYALHVNSVQEANEYASYALTKDGNYGF